MMKNLTLRDIIYINDLIIKKHGFNDGNIYPHTVTLEGDTTEIFKMLLKK